MKKTFTISVLPRSSKNEVVSEQADGSLKVKLTAAPVDGVANKKLIEILSDYFAIKKSHIKIVRGLTSRKKIVEIDDN